MLDTKTKLIGLTLLLASPLYADPKLAEADEAFIEKSMAAMPTTSDNTRVEYSDVVSISEIRNYVGHEVRVTLNNSRTRQGVVEKVTKDSLLVRSRLNWGEASYSLPLTQIREIRIR